MKFPSLTIYTDNLPANVGGCANAFVVRIRNKYREDQGIHAHEYEHVRQWYVGVLIGLAAALALKLIPTIAFWSALWPLAVLVGCALHPLAYLLLPGYKLWAEARAYRIQSGYYPDDRRPLFAGFLASNYGLNITADEALAAIRS